ncbi:MAG: hypothetical protein ABEJ61_03990 [Haloferacaceae archaeon]
MQQSTDSDRVRRIALMGLVGVDAGPLAAVSPIVVAGAVVTVPFFLSVANLVVERSFPSLAAFARFVEWTGRGGGAPRWLEGGRVGTRPQRRVTKVK